MAKLRAFIGHSFNEEDSSIITAFLKHFDSLKDIGFEWEHAERAEAKELAYKVIEKMEGKNLFIGIFTKKNKQISPSHLKSCFWSKQSLKAPSNEFSWTTSDWVLQESGYALGKGLKVIFLVEAEIESVGGLQGNREYITFNRNNVSQCFTKLNEMITSLMKSSSIEVQKETKDIPSEDSTEIPKTNKEVSSFEKLLIAIKENKENEERTAFEELLSKDTDKYKQVETKGFYYWMRYRYGKKDVLEDLRNLSKENPEHPNPRILLGNLYEEYKQFDRAYEQFIKAAELSKNDIDKTTFICKAARTLTDEGKFKEATELLIERITTVNSKSEDELFELYRTLSQTQKKANSIEKYLSLAEKVLELKPLDSSIRFDLAYTYSKNKNHIMALHHYQILCNSTPNNDANWNNLGVELSELGLEGKSVEAYMKSKEFGGTTAVGNIAYKLIDEGFYSEAKKYLQEALKQADCSSNVSNALSNLENKLEQENQKESEILSGVSATIKFRVKYAEAYTKKRAVATSLQKKWKAKHGDVEITLTGNKFAANATHEIPRMGLADLYAGYTVGGMAKPKIDIDIEIINYEGVIINGAIDYELSVMTKPSGKADRATKAGSLLGALIDSNENTVRYNGQMIISEDNKKIEVMERDSKDNITFYDMIPVKDE